VRAIAALVLVLSWPALAQDAPLRATFEAPPASLAVGAHATLVLVVTSDVSARQPFLVTPSSDGPAVEVVHGRLFRTDAEDPTAEPLRFRIPIVAAGPGDAVVRARIDGYACEGDVCEPVQAEAEVALRIVSRPASP
jgi:hypothetical protein